MLPSFEGIRRQKAYYEYIIHQFLCYQVLICFINLYFYYSPKEPRKAIQEDPHTLEFVKRGVRAHHNEVHKVGFLGCPNDMCADTVEL
jgi:hypothetical protein